MTRVAIMLAMLAACGKPSTTADATARVSAIPPVHASAEASPSAGATPDAAAAVSAELPCDAMSRQMPEIDARKLARDARDPKAGRIVVRRGDAILEKKRVDTIVLATSDGKRCDRFYAREQPSAKGPFYGFVGSNERWHAVEYIGEGDFGSLVLAVLDDKNSVVALWEHPHNVNMDAGSSFALLAVTDGGMLPVVSSTSGGDGLTDAFLEVYGLGADGTPKVLFSTGGHGVMPIAEARLSARTAGDRRLFDAITSALKTPGKPCAPAAECMVCKKRTYTFDATKVTFTPVGAATAVECPTE